MEGIDFTVTEVSLAYYRKLPQGYTFSTDSRPAYGLTLIINGTLEMNMGDKKIVAEPGNIILQQKGDNYRLFAPDACGVEYVVISYMATPEDVLKKYLPERLLDSTNLKYQRFFENVAHNFSSYSITSAPLLRALVQEIVCNVICDVNSTAQQFHNQPLERAKQYINENFSKPITTIDIASAAGFSPSYLRTLFHKIMGQSPMNYLNQVRINHAKEMLSSKMFTLSEVASSCGFQNEYYFNRVFKKFAGITPGKY